MSSISPWTDHARAVVRELYPTTPIEQILQRLPPGFTKSRVIGWAYRQGLVALPSPARKPHTNEMLKGRKRVVPAKATVADRQFDTLIDSWPDPAPMALIDADFRGCRFIKGAPTPLRHGMYCGKACVEASSYCAGHHALTYNGARSGAPHGGRDGERVE